MNIELFLSIVLFKLKITINCTYKTTGEIGTFTVFWWWQLLNLLSRLCNIGNAGGWTVICLKWTSVTTFAALSGTTL